ncbi:MAG: hypothetical protein MJY84_01960 [Bacteroidales bacterium]|nr:hypothetical protein [Bacteroidales bacterium]
MSAAVILCSLNTFAQDDFRKAFDEFTEKARSEYSSFREESNRNFIEFLKAAWEEYKAEPAIPVPDEEEIPPVIYEEKRETLDDNPLPVIDVTPSPEIEPQPTPVEPIEESPVFSFFEFEYFGTPLKVRIGDGTEVRLKSVSGEDLAAAWEGMLTPANDNLLYDCLAIRDEYKLCDWAYLLMLLELSGELQDSDNEAVLMAAYLYSQSGYMMRLAAAGDELHMLFASDYKIFGVPYYKIDDTNFYPLKEISPELQVADYSFPNERKLSFMMKEEPAFAMKSEASRKFSTEKYSITASCYVNRNLLDFFDCYPMSMLNENPMSIWAMYAETPLDNAVKDALYPSLKKAVEGYDIPGAADVLLDFVQSLPYGYDDKIWGRDRAFFAEETLYYPYCDCEDRAILYSHLVRDLLGLDVILVYYPGHLAAAVKFKEAVKGDYISIDNERFLVCDPTFIGAPIGVTMPGMDNKGAQVILLQ